MDHADVVGSLEVALIELEYASADFAHNRASLGREVDARMLNEIAAKLSAAQRAMAIALQTLSGDSEASLAQHAA